MARSNQIKACVVGAGSWGTALANVLAETGTSVSLWARDAELATEINTTHQNTKYLTGRPLHAGVVASTNLAQCIEESSIVVCSIPTQKIRGVFSPVKNLLAGKTLVNASKGIEIETGSRVSQLFESIASLKSYLVLSGPSFAQDVVDRLPTAVTLAGTSEESLREVQRLFHAPYFKAYTSKDVVGVELAGALKNVIALAAGVVNGLGLGLNTQAAVVTRGLAEVARMGRRLGADPMTFLGLAGMGDMILTCTGGLSRNRQAGVLIGQGHPFSKVPEAIGGVAEGITTAKAVHALYTEFQVDMPICSEVYGILYEGHSVAQAVRSLLDRELKDEFQ